MSLQIASRWLLLLFLIGGVSGCEETGPATPSGPVPEIARVDPAEVAAGPGVQTLSIAGQGFTSGLTLLVTPPSGVRRAVGGDAIQGLQSVSFQVSMTFESPGDYVLAVRLVSGAESNEFKLPARAQGGNNPRIDGVTPATIQSSATTTTVTLSGANFTSGATVSITTPDGATTTLPAGSVVAVTPTSMQVSIVFSTPGAYSFNVTSPEGLASNTVTITAF